MRELKARKKLEIRFSEVDSMKVVWHGSYPLYFEDAREEFGKAYGIGYMTILANDCYAPLVDLSFKYKSPIVYGMSPVIEIRYIPTEAAKLVFEYTIFDENDNRVLVTGKSVQVFTDLNYQLLWESPEFYRLWKKKWEVI